ncbi:MAG: zinc ABC transporter substrate-binding protein, partial [Candidatus Competibacteraceae bacterium]|nr:zinc ABC transporter substrate-binding protein [Candidatus Competibacteraceae bacterium]
MQSHSLLLKGLQNWLKILLLLLPLAGFTAGLPVMVSIKPVHSLVASVMQGVDEPFLLVKGGASPHDYRLRPSDARAMEQARVAFWIGPGMENFLTKPLENVQGKIRAVALLETPGIKVLPLRTGGAWEGHRHDYESSSDDHDHDHDHDHGH